jgi:hypothetical protein
MKVVNTFFGQNCLNKNCIAFKQNQLVQYHFVPGAFSVDEMQNINAQKLLGSIDVWATRF